MIKYLTLIGLVFGSFFSAQNYFFAAPEGFGAATTGGGSATPVTVSTYADLKAQMISAGPKVILVSGTITIPSGQPINAIVSNKSIIGLPGAKLVNENQSNPGAGIFYLKNGSTNVIIRNLIFVGPAAYDIDGQDNLTADGITKLWVDHCEFQDGQDGNFDIKGLSDNITVSWCKFTYLKPPVAGGSGGSNDHRFSNLVGSSATDKPVDGHYSVTFQNCYWASGCKDRMPRARNAELHLLNCYYYVNVSGSKGLNLGGGTNNSTAYVENTNFENVATPYATATSDGGTVAVNFVNSIRGGTNIGTVNPPSYIATVMPINEVATRITDSTCGAGASLMVNANGEVSPSTCTNLSVSEGVKSKFQIYPTLVKDFLHISSLGSVSKPLQIEIFSADGIKVFNEIKNFENQENIRLNLTKLTPGIYYCIINDNSKKSSQKFLKN